MSPVVALLTSDCIADKRESQRSADILTRIIVDPEFAKHVKTLRVFYQGRDVSPMTFQTGKEQRGTSFADLHQYDFQECSPMLYPNYTTSGMYTALCVGGI